MRKTRTQTGRPSGARTIAPMSLDRAPLEQDNSAIQHDWFAPIAMFIAWLAHLFDQISKLKRIRRTTKFKSNWRDHWQDLRQCEWMRDQILAAGAAQMLAGKALDLDAFIPTIEPPSDYGGPCPKTPFEMNRRFLAIARFNADPEPAIRAHAKRIAQREDIDLDSPLRLATRATSPGFAGGGLNACCAEKSSLADRRGRWIATSLSRDGGGCARARGPPFQFGLSVRRDLAITRLAGFTREIAPACALRCAWASSPQPSSVEPAAARRPWRTPPSPPANVASALPSASGRVRRTSTS